MILQNMKNSVFLLVILLTTACSNKNSFDNSIVEQSENESGIDSLKVNEESDISQQRPVYRATETVFTDLIHTKLEVNFDWTKSRMNGIATISAKPHFYATDSLILDAKGMDILKVQIDSKDLTYTYDSSYLKIKLNKTYSRNDKYTVVINYVAKPDERKTAGSAAITSDKGLYFINPKGEDKNKMPQIWTQGETEASSVWFPTIDSPNMKSTQEIFITVEDKFVTLSNGKMISSKKNTNGTRTDHWKQELAHAPYLFMMGVGEFKIVKDSYTRPDGTKMEVNYYVEPEWEQYAKAIFGETPQMIKHFSQLLGYEYAWDKYNQIIVRDYVSGAMENTGAVVFGDYAYKTTRELVDGNDQSTIAHELFHHWFGDLVTAESWSNLPLNESFANYSQYLWDEHRFGLDEADYQAETEADGYYQTAQMQGYHDLIWFDFDDKEQMFDGHSYNKGGRILHMLRNYLGDEAFFAGIKNYLTTNNFKAAEYHQLRLAFEEVSGEDLNWFFDQWFKGSGHPILEINQTINAEKSTVTVTVKQNQSLELSPIYKLPLEIAVFDAGGKHIHKVIIDKLEQSFELPFNGIVKSVIFDNQQMLLAKIREEKPIDQYVFQYYNGERYKARKDGLMFGSKSKDQKGQQLILDALNDRFWSIRLIAIEKAVKLNAENKGKGLALIKDLALKDSNSQVRSSALNYLGNNLEGAEIEGIYSESIEKDQSYLVVSTALKNLGKINPKVAMEKAKPLEAEKSSKMLVGIAQLYGAHGEKDKFSFFEAVLKGNSLQGFDQLGVMNSLTFFISRQEIEMINQSFNLYESMSKEGGFYTKMFLPQNITYLISMFDAKIEELNEEIAAYEKNNDALYADQARKKQKEFKDLKAKFEPLSEKKEGE
jgi:aminopeptidase N